MSEDEDVEVRRPFDSELAGAESDVPEPPRWHRPEPTGVAGVDDAVALLAELDVLPTGDHVAVYDKVHRQLQDSLADLDGP